jgi:hypothetical protein
MSRRSLDEWRRAVFQSHKITDPVRVYLLYLAEHMRADRKVSVPQARVESALGKSKRQVDERRAKAIEAGLLTRVSPGYKGHTAVYQGLFPTRERVTPTSTLSVRQGVTLSTLQRVTPHNTPLQEADLFARGKDRDVGSYDEHRDRPTAYGLTVCDCHGFTDCANLPRPLDREESA